MYLHNHCYRASPENGYIDQYHVTLLSNFLLAFDKYSRTYNKERIAQSSYPGLFFLLDRDKIEIGIEKYTKLFKQLNQPNNKLIVIETRVPLSSLKSNDKTPTGLGRYIESNQIYVDAVYYLGDGKVVSARIEDVIADAYRVLKPTLNTYEQLVPRSISILPVAKGCQANCAFCFSSASISSNTRQQALDYHRIELALYKAKEAGAERAVITGGGEPGLLQLYKLVALIKLCRKYFSKVVLISNGYFISRANPPTLALERLANAGLSVLSLSHHHYDPIKNQAIMSLDVNIRAIAQGFQNIKSRYNGFQLRLVCVLQQSGLANEHDVQAYIDWAGTLDIQQICFKELYVSSSRESYYFNEDSNHWSYCNQVPLSLITEYAKTQNWTLSKQLPWGSPVYTLKQNNNTMSLAAYTEPSLSWELQNGICRSWNLMADGRCFASLESRDSEIHLST